MIKRAVFRLLLIAYFGAVTFSLMLACAHVYFKLLAAKAA